MFQFGQIINLTINLTLELTLNLSKCKSKADQIEVIARLDCKFLYYEMPNAKDCDVSRECGVTILIRKTIQHQLIPPRNTSNIESIHIKICSGNGTIYIYKCYFPGEVTEGTIRGEICFIKIFNTITWE